MVNFMIIGAAKSGTTALHSILDNHKNICMSTKKETNFFAYYKNKIVYREPWKTESEMAKQLKNRITSLEQYESLFPDKQKICGESSPWYMYNPEVPQKVHDYNPSMKIIAILRNPAERAYANFGHNVRDGKLPPNISCITAFEQEDEMLKDNIHPLVAAYKAPGYYAKHLKSWSKYFTKSQILVINYEEFRENQREVVSRILSFIDEALDVNDIDESKMKERKNVTGVPKSRFIKNITEKDSFVKELAKKILPSSIFQKAKHSLKNFNLRPMTKMSQEEYDYLIGHYKEDMDLLEKEWNIKFKEKNYV